MKNTRPPFALIKRKQGISLFSKYALLSLLFVATLFLQKSKAQIHIQSGATVTTNGNVQITLDEISFDNSGTFDGINSTLTIQESTGSSNLNFGGSGTTTLNHLNIDLQTQDVLLTGEVMVEGDLTFLDGHFDLNGNDLLLGNNALLLGESESTSFIGSNGGEIVIEDFALSGATPINPGNLGAEITPDGDLGLTTIRRGHVPQGQGSETGINRYYNISPTENSGLNATLRFHYLDAELAGQIEQELEFRRLEGSTWTNEGITLLDMTANYAVLEGVEAFSIWTLADLSNPLPVELLLFEARATEKETVHLFWKTATEINNAGFEIQHCVDGSNWKILDFVKGAGNITAVQHYKFIHNKPVSGNNYYRLKQVDFDGRFEYSETKVVWFESTELFELTLHPNPTRNYLNLGQVIFGDYQIVNVLGQIVKKGNFLETNGLDVSELRAGTYLLIILTAEQKLLTAKFVKID